MRETGRSRVVDWKEKRPESDAGERGGATDSLARNGLFVPSSIDVADGRRSIYTRVSRSVAIIAGGR